MLHSLAMAATENGTIFNFIELWDRLDKLKHIFSTNTEEDCQTIFDILNTLTDCTHRQRHLLLKLIDKIEQLEEAVSVFDASSS